MERFWKYKVDHVIFWIATVAFHMYTRADLIRQAGLDEFFLEIIFRNVLLAIVIYLNILILIPRFAKTGSWIYYFVLLIASLCFYVFAKGFHDVYLSTNVSGIPHRGSVFTTAFYNLSIVLFYMSFSVALQLSREWYEQREVIRRIEFEKVNAELDYLKAQINPHFLFNSINTIYFQIDRKNTVARDALSAFSNMLRYQLYECNGSEIAIEKEIIYLQHYIDLQRQRRDEHYHINFHHDDPKDFSIAPLLLIPFIENAFKHVSDFPAGNEIQIAISRSNNTFRLEVSNTVDLESKRQGSGGIGLTNVKRRLELLYKNRHRLTLLSLPERYHVKLELDLN